MDKKTGNYYDYRTLRSIINANHDRFSSLNFDDSMSLLQKMNALVEYFKVMLQEYDDWIAYLDDFQDKFDENIYKTTEDILNKWVTDGVFDTIINETVLKDLNKKIDDFKKDTQASLNAKVGKGENESITTRMIAPDLMSIITNGGDVSVNTSMIEDGAVTSAKLSDYYTDKGYLITPDLNTVVKHGTYLISYGDGSGANFPLNASGILTVSGNNSANQGRVIQTYISIIPPYYRYYRVIDLTNAIYQKWEESVPDKYITRKKLNDNFMSNGSKTGVDFNTLLNDGTYVITASNENVNRPENILESVLLTVKTNGVWTHQECRVLQDPARVAYRYGMASNNTWSKWFNNSTSNGSRTGVDMNTLLDNGTYVIVASEENINRPENIPDSALLTVKTNGIWTHQEYRALQNPVVVSYRYGIANQEIWGDWASEQNGGTSLNLKGKKVAVFGDSQIGNTQDTTSVTSNIALETGADVYNYGFGGCRMGKHDSTLGWDWFSMYRLADELVKPLTDETRFSPQESAVSNSSWTSMPSYFPNTVSKLKTLDLSKIDMMVIHYGTNDYTGGLPLDNTENKLDTNTFGGALRYSLEKIMRAFPNLKILLDTPTFRVWFEGNEVIEDSDTKEYNSNVLPDFVEKEKNIAKEYKLNVLDLYYELGINKFNCTSVFNITDGTHQNANGRKILGQQIGKKLIMI